MPPIDLPPGTPQEALRLERFRNAVVCLWPTPERGERPHGGEPKLSLLSSGASSGPGSATVYPVIIVPELDSASNEIIQGIRFVRLSDILLTPADYGR